MPAHSLLLIDTTRTIAYLRHMASTTQTQPCWKCSGTGLYQQFGICFKCGGSGKIRKSARRAAPKAQCSCDDPNAIVMCFVHPNGKAN
jgi:DnaJ-class molecular chaperone